MVSRESATRNLCKLRPSLTIQIDKNHSEMVKFGMGDHYIRVLASELQRICALPEIPTTQLEPQTFRHLSQPELTDPALPSNPCQDSGDTHSAEKPFLQPEWILPDIWDDDLIMSSLRAPERDRRLEQINRKFGDTFNWVYDDASVGLSEWLHKGTGIFWVHGKPASGKSTLMKYLYQDPRTEELLRAGGLKSRARLTTASFFFHHRGNYMQKSFEGLLSSLASQILDQTRSLVSLLYPILEDQYRARIASSGLGSLEKDIWALLDCCEVPCSSRLTIEVEKIVVSQWHLTKTRQFGTRLTRMLQDLGIKLDFNPRGQFGKVDLDDPDDIMSTATDPQPIQGQDDPPERPKSTRRTADVIRTLQRQYRREKLKMDIQTRQWSGAELEDCLRRLIGQSLFQMNLFLFLDALDEYDGRPEFIASFLQDLVQQPADPSRQPSTHTRILFSSRPWKALSDEFSACPGFQIHDYTWNDIIDFCAASIPAEVTAKTLLSPFVPEIVRRARGVFLWVELVMRDLAERVRQRSQLHDTQELKQDLRKTLDEIPDELGDYYRVIVERIPPATRWESYVILETLVRTENDIETMTLMEILKCSSSRSVRDAEERVKQNSHMLGSDWGERYIKTVSGGLVEFGGRSRNGEPIVQFMHQTVKQFVLGPWFRLRLLGSNVGELTTENGHSFISRYLFVKMDFDGSFSYHAREAEVTTGSSQYEFFSTAPRDHFPFGPVRNRRYMPSMIALAVFAGLQLCVSDAHGADQGCVQRNSTTLINTLLDSDKERKETGETLDNIISMAEVLVAKGLSIDPLDNGFLEVLQRMWNKTWPELQENSYGLHLGRNSPLPQRLYSPIKPEYEQLACILADAISRPIARTEMTQLFHYATPKLVRAILDRGLDPFALNMPMANAGKTPIDFVLLRDLSYSQKPRENLLHQYDIVSQLVCAGGTLFSIRPNQWSQWEKDFANAGLDTGVFREAGFPRWYSKAPRSTGDGLLRRYLTKVFRVKESNTS